MNIQIRSLGAFAFFALVSILSAQPSEIRESTTVLPPVNVPPPAPTDGPVIKLALLLDTSNSMDGLINQARSRLWQVVNEMGKARVDGRLPQLQVALFQYGNSRLSEADDYVQLRCPFTTDLDVVSEQLFALSTDGGSEYCGAVIRESIQRLNWGQSNEGPVLRVIVIAGNEPFNQGSESYVESVGTARRLNIRVNTIFCGNRDEGRRTLWADGANRGNGHYTAIDQNQVLPEIETPFDDAIMRLNEVLNGTYLGYGSTGKESLERQIAQDSLNSELSISGGVSRAQAKASANYETAHWDLVSAVEEGELTLSDVDAAALPAMMQGKSEEENVALLEAMTEKRKATAAEIRELTAKRAEFIAEARREASAQGQSLDDALIAALRHQATEIGFAFPE